MATSLLAAGLDGRPVWVRAEGLDSGRVPAWAGLAVTEGEAGVGLLIVCERTALSFFIQGDDGVYRFVSEAWLTGDRAAGLVRAFFDAPGAPVVDLSPSDRTLSFQQPAALEHHASANQAGPSSSPPSQST